MTQSLSRGIYLGIVPRKDLPACADIETRTDSKGREVLGLELVEFEDAFEQPREGDEYFVGYFVEGDHELARLTNSSATQIARKPGYRVVQSTVAIDVDNNSKHKWTPKTLKQFTELVKTARKPTVYYTTQHGARFVYALTENISIKRVRNILITLIEEFQSLGFLGVDEACKDWNRLFRLPFVIREGEPQWNQWWFQIEHNYDTLLDPKELEHSLPSLPKADLPVLDLSNELPKPIPLKKGKGTKEWVKRAKKLLRNRESCTALFEEGGESGLDRPGERDTTLTRLVGGVVSLLFHQDYTQEQIYSLFYPIVQGMPPDEKDPGKDWVRVLWDKIQRFWHAEELKVVQEKEETVTLIDRLLKGVREWADEKDLEIFDPDKEKAFNFIRDKLIVCCASSYFVMTSQGRYYPMPVTKEQLVAQVRNLKMEPLMPLTELNTQGVPVGVTSQKLIDKYGLPVTGVEGQIGTANYVTGLRGGDDSKKFILEMFRRREDLAPEFVPEVDEWMREFAGVGYQMLREWISYSLAFDEFPIKILSIVGPPSCGKKLLIQGLAECITSKIFATGSDLGKFQSLFLRTPFLVINEGFPNKHMMSGPPGILIKNLMSGDNIRIEEKYRAPISIKSPLRIIFTANSFDIISDLVKDKDLTTKERESIEKRIIHLNIPKTCAMWLQDTMGGHRHTAGWIRGDAGQESQNIIAKHFMYLYESRTDRECSRWFMESYASPEISNFLRKVSGKASEVMEIVIGMIASGKPEIVILDEYKIFVTNQAVLDRCRKADSIKHTINTSGVGNALRNFSMNGEESPKPRKIKGHTARWWELDLQFLWEFSLELGNRKATDILDGMLVKKHEAEGTRRPTDPEPEDGEGPPPDIS